MKKLIYFILLLFVIVSCSCDVKAQDTDLKIVSWNVQNVFDAIDDSTEYSEYTSSGHWSDSLYRIRLDQINTVFSYEKLKDCDVVVLNEVENENVVRDILKLKNFEKNNFLYYVCASEINGAISTAVLSKYPIENVKIHSITSCRPVIECKVVCASPFYLFACHAKSRKEGVEETKNIRLEIGKVINERKEELLKDNSEAVLVAAGDFNEDWTDSNIFSRVVSSISFADSPLLISDICNNGFWYCFWLDQTLSLSSQGSYYYQGKWSCFDNILIYGKDVLDCGVVNEGILSKADRTPNAWVRKSAVGVSDHFPVYLVISN